ncbi:MAG: polysaccharide biosynthesis/export family protein [Hyphomicrobiales bacterium]
MPAGQSVYLRGQLPAAPQPVAVQQGPMPVAQPAVLAPGSHVPQPVYRPASAEVPAQSPGGVPYRLDSGDVLRVVVFGQDTLSNDYSIDGGGFISMPLIGPVPARGQTTFALEDRIASMLKQKYVKDPKVTVEVRTYRPFFILGEVRRPGQFPYVNGMTVQTAVAIAGGYTERARESRMKITRKAGGVPQTFMVPQDFPVQPGDTVYITERLF